MTAYNPPSGSTDANAPYQGKNVAAGQQGSKVPRAAVENPQRELVNLIGEAGITPTNDDLAQAMRAVRGGQLTTFTDTSATVNQITIGPKTAHTTLIKGLPFRIFPALSNTGAVVLKVGTLTASLKGLGGVDPAKGDIIAGQPLDVVFDGSFFRATSPLQSEIVAIIAASGTVPVIQTIAVTLWVRPDSNDATADGSQNTALKAFKTIAAAVAYGAARFYTPGIGLKIRLGLAGTYDPPGSIAVGTQVQIAGDSANPNSCILSGPGPGTGGGTLAGAISGTQLSLLGLTLNNTGTINGHVGASGVASVGLTSVIITSPNPTAQPQIFAAAGASITIGTGVILTGSASMALYVSGGFITIAGTLTVQGTPNYSVGFAIAQNSGGNITVVPPAQLVGSATGRRYSVILNATINVAGGTINYFPGDTAGTTNSGGQYAA